MKKSKDSRRKLFWFLLVLILIVYFSLLNIEKLPPIDNANTTKVPSFNDSIYEEDNYIIIVNVTFNADDNITLNEYKIRQNGIVSNNYGINMAGDYRVEVLDGKKEVTQSFGLWDPRIILGEEGGGFVLNESIAIIEANVNLNRERYLIIKDKEKNTKFEFDMFPEINRIKMAVKLDKIRNG